MIETYNPTKVYFYEAIYSIPYNQFLIQHARLFSELSKEKIDQAMVDRLVTFYKKGAKETFHGMNMPTERKLVYNLLEMYVAQVPEEQYSTELVTLLSNHKKDLEFFVNRQMDISVFGNEEKYTAFLENPTLAAMEEDRLFILMKDLMANYRTIIGQEDLVKANDLLDNANRLFVAGLREMNPDKKYYPNANSTLRLTYGNVGRYKKSDGLLYDFYTTIEGLMAKENPDDDEFIVPAKLKELYNKKDYGRYGQDGNLRVNFISNNDITGGNSGSPVMNSKGELIGCAFDGNWEAMSGDIAFEATFQRTISVDIRYVLFVIDKYAGATNLIEEMTIVE